MKQLTDEVLLDKLKLLFAYDPLTGLITRTSDRNKFKAGTAIGSKNPMGYVLLQFQGIRLKAHRVAWAFHTGKFPDKETHIDHINGNKSDNRMVNLRAVSRSMNMQNLRGPNTRNKVGVLGVNISDGRFRATLGVDGRKIHLGVFDTKELAHAAYIKAKAKFHPGYVHPEQPVHVNAMLVEALQAAEKLEHEALVAISEATYELKVGNTYTTATDTYKANNDLIHRLDKILNLQYRDRKRTALTAAKQAQPEPFTPDWSQDSAAAESIREHQAICNLLLKEMRYIAGISTGQVKRVAEQALEAVKQAQPERAPLSEAELEQEFCKITGLETGINPAAADTKRALVWFKKGYAHGIKQGGQR